MNKAAWSVCCLIATLLLSSAAFAAAPVTEAPAGFEVQTKGESGWVTRAQVSFGLPLEERAIDVSSYLPDADGAYRVRIAHGPAGPAHLDGVLLSASGKNLRLARAVDLETRGDVTRKLSSSDNDVINADGRSIELRFVAPDKRLTTLRLAIRGREQIVASLPGGPCGYPEMDYIPYALNQRPGSLVADGRFTPEDRLGEPFFKDFTMPVTGHPDGYTYGYLKNDAEYLYGAVDFTSDNTYDDNEDFSAIAVRTDAGERMFRVSVPERRYGNPGFTYTDKVGYQHKVYEFRIPLAEVRDAIAPDGRMNVRFVAYGTSGCAMPLSVRLGPQNPDAGALWLGDAVAPFVMMQFEIWHNGDPADPPPAYPVDVTSIKITAAGTGHDVNDLIDVRLFHDADWDGAVSPGDAELATATFIGDNQTATFDLSAPPFTINVPQNRFLVVEGLKPATVDDSTFSTSIVAPADVQIDAGAPCPGTTVVISSGNGNTMTVDHYGMSTAAAGAHNPAAAEVHAGDVDVPMLQLAISAGPPEALDLTSLTITDSGGGSNAASVSAVRLWEDADGSGTVTSGDVQLNADQSFTQGTNTLTLTAATASQIAAGGSKHYLVTYSFAAPSIAGLAPFDRLSRAAERWARAALIPLLSPFTLAGCGGGGGASTTVDASYALSGAPEGFLFTDAAGNTLSSAKAGEVVQVRNADGLPVLQFTMGAADVNLEGAVLGRNSLGTLVAFNVAAAMAVKSVAGMSGDITAFVPCGATHTALRVCPQTSALPANGADCSGETRLTSAAAASGGYAWSNPDRTGAGDCQVAGSASLFDSFYAEGLSFASFKAAVMEADIVLTGASSLRSIRPGSFSAEGGTMTLATP